MQLCLASAADQEAICDLLADAGLPTHDVSPELCASFLVVKRDATIIATGAVERAAGEGLLRSVAVTPSLRSQGLGHRIVNALEAKARRDGLSALYLLTTSSADYFARLGYEPLAREDAPPSIRATAEFTTLCPASSTLMVKKIGQWDTDDRD